MDAAPTTHAAVLGVFGVDEALIAQAYHLPRAVAYRSLNIKTTGVPVEQSRYVRSRCCFSFQKAFAT